MTRKEELAERAKAIIDEMAFRPFYPLQSEIRKTLLQVERECWSKAADKLDALLSMENESTDDQAWEFLAWLRDQLKEVSA